MIRLQLKVIWTWATLLVNAPCRFPWTILYCLTGSLLATSTGKAEGFSAESIGARFGLGSSHSSGEFRQADVALKWNLPWQNEFGSKMLQTRLEASAGWLGDYHEHGAVMAVGPSLLLSHARFPVSLELGFQPTLLSRTHYSAKDFGVPVQFTSFAGLNWDIGSHLRLGYRFQHMSNASLHDSNPGLNMSLFGLSYRF